MKLISVFFICWIAPSLLFFYLPVPDSISSFQQSLTLYLFVGIYLFLASSLSFWVIRRVLLMDLRTIYVNGGAVLFILAGVYWITGRTEVLPIYLASLSTANLLFGATLLGAALSVAIKRLGELVPVCLTAAAADVTSVVKGPTKKMTEELTSYYQGGMRGEAPMVDSVLIKAGVPGYEMPVPLFGVSDWILLVLFSSALVRLNKSDNMLNGEKYEPHYFYFPVTAFALYLCLLTAQITGNFLPAMVFICCVFLLYLVWKHSVHKHLQKIDIFNSFVFPGAAVCVILLFAR